MFCRNCGEELLDGIAFCPKCGAIQSDSEGNENAGQSSGGMPLKTQAAGKGLNTAITFATAGFILGLISWILNLFGIVGILAVVFSSLGLSNRHLNSRGRAFAIIGLVSGIINIIYVVCVLLSYA